MTHSQYLLPALPDLLKSHRLSYKKFLHNGIDEEFDLLSAKTELNEEEIFYEGLKLNHVDELSPSQVESLDYIYHAEEKIFLIPKRTLEDSLRGRQSHSFHLFIPLEVKILPFQDELDPSHFTGTNLLNGGQPSEPSENKKEITRGSEAASGGPISLAANHNEPTPLATEDSLQQTKVSRPTAASGPLTGASHSRLSSPDVFFRGGSGSPLSEIRKEFFQTALTFFFQQPKIQKLLITKRFLLLRWFCEKLQYINPTSSSTPEPLDHWTPTTSNVGPWGPVGYEVLGYGWGTEVGNQFDLIFAKFDRETKTQVYQIYQNILLKFENQTQKRPAAKREPTKWAPMGKSRQRNLRLGNSPRSGLRSTSSQKNKEMGSVTARRAKRGSAAIEIGQNRIKLFQKTSRWAELITVAREQQSWSATPEVGYQQPTSWTADRYPKFPDLPVHTSQTFGHFKNFLQSKANSNLSASSSLPTQHEKGNSQQPTLQLPGFHFKTTGLTAGRKLVPPRASCTPPNWTANSFAQPAEGSSSFIRFGKVENVKVKSHQTFAKRSLRSSKLTQRVTFLRRVVQAKDLKNKKKQLQEIFLTLFPVIPEKKGLRFWKVRNFQKREDQLATKSALHFAVGANGQLNPTANKTPGTAVGSDPTATFASPWDADAVGRQMGSRKSKFLRHLKTPVQMKRERLFHFLSPTKLKQILKPVAVTRETGNSSQQPAALVRGPIGSRTNQQLKSLQNSGRSLRLKSLPASSAAPLEFLSLPQNEVGSLWKILPKMTFPQQQPRARYQLHKLAYRQRNMFLLHTNMVGSGKEPKSLAAGTRFTGSSSRTPGKPAGPHGLAKLAVGSRVRGVMKAIPPRGNAANKVGKTQKPTKLTATKLTAVGSKKAKSFVKPTSVSRPAHQRSGMLAAVQGFRKKFNFDRFFLKAKERQALHLKENLKLREKVACRIEKKSAKLRLLPGLEVWEKSHSEKRVEEYWESLLQPYRQKIASKLLASLPSGNVVFVKSEKDSRPKRVKTFLELESTNFVGRISGANSVVATNFVGPADVDQRMALAGQKVSLETNRFKGSRAAANKVGSKAANKVGSKKRLLKLPTKLAKPFAGTNEVGSSSQNQMFWALELMNMKFFMKKVLTYSPVILEFYWKSRFRFLWKALSEPINPLDSTSPLRASPRRGVATAPARAAARFEMAAGSFAASGERKNLPKVCSDLRQLLSTFQEMMVRENTEPQKYFLSGQVGKKEWPFQKDGSKSYFALLNLGKMPFMTKQGHFLINGSPRVLVSQIAKCPNFYTKMKIDSRGRPRYWTEFVSSFKNAGEWIQFHIDLENKMFFSLGTKRKYSIFIFLGALGISPPEIPDVIEHWDFLKQSIHKEEILIDQNQNFLTYLVEPLEVREARVLFHDTQNYSFFPGGEKTDEELQKFFEDIFYNPSRYFLGHAGREALNQRRRFSGTPSRSRALEKEDFLAAINALIEVRLGLAPPDDIDHLKFRRVRLPGELLQNEFHLALDEIFTLDFTKFREGPLPGDALESQPKDQRRTIFPTLYDLEQKIFEKGRPFAVSKTVGIQSTYQVSPLEKRMRNFFHTGQLSQYMDQTNPLAEITHKRRLTSLGPDGLPKQVGVAVRELHPSHFGRICPIETPEGLNAGLVASLSSQAKIGSHHTLLAPYYWVKDRTREFPQKIFHNEILAGAASGGIPQSGRTANGPALTAVGSPLQVLKYPPVLPEVIFLSASAEDSVYICSEDYWFSSKYKNFETIADTRFTDSTLKGADALNEGAIVSTSSALPLKDQLVGPAVGSATDPISLDAPTSWAASTKLGAAGKYSQVDSKNSLVKFQTVFPARYQQEFFTVTKSQIDFFALCPTQMISVGTSLIPFLEHDDANRALMGSNMQRQALPLLVLERPLVGTGSEKGVAQSSNSVLLSEFSGQVSFADGRKIVVDSFPKKITSFPEPCNTKNSRLLLGQHSWPQSSEFSSSGSGGGSVQGAHKASQDTALGESTPLGNALDFGHRNLFQKFQNRTEDGKVKTISRIFTVKLKIQTADYDPTDQRSRLLAKGGDAHSSTTPKFVTKLKVFPISDEEYEKSRNLLRREFLKKYKEIQNKKVFPGDFWPGERWKKTGDIWKLRPTKVGAHFMGCSAANEIGYVQEGAKAKGPAAHGPAKLAIGSSFGAKLALGLAHEMGQQSQRVEEMKRIRYKKANLMLPTSSTPPKWAAREAGGGGDSVGTISSRVRKFSEKKGPTMSHFILKKKTLRRSLLPLKAGGLFFEPTPQMIFKNILSKNSKKREILRKAFVQKAFIPQRLEFQQQPTASLAPKELPPRWAAGQLARTSKAEKGRKFTIDRSPFPTSFAELLPTKLATAGADEVGLLVRFGAVGQLRRSHPGNSRSKVSWSVSMKKVTPYTQVTYNIHGYWRTNQNTLRRQRPAVHAGDWVAAGDLLADSSATLRGELCVGQNILVGYVPWEGYNFEDAIVVNERLVEEDIYTSILIDRYEMEAAIDAGEKITRKIPDLKPHLLKNLDLRGIICVGTWVEEDDILVGKILPVTTELQGYSKLLADIYQIAPPVAKDVSFRVPDRISGRVLECSVSEMIVRTPDNQSFSTPWKVTLYLVEKRRMKLGDKMSGRHGNKGIVSIILPPQDMPFLPDGTPLDVALNPLGVPSRMNVGQLLESLLGLAGKHLHQKYRIPAFDEMYGEDFSRRIVYDKLLEASQKTQKPWLFNPNFPGKMMLRDGRTGDYFHQPILVGYPYMLKLIHMVDDKMHARATGPYTMVTQQPLKGRANRGGQRIGEMEVWAVEAFAASYALQELLTLKSDDITGRNHFLMSFLKRKKRTVGGIPDAFRVLMHELQSLCFHVHYTEDYRLTYPTLLESSKIPETPVPGNYGRGS